MKTRSYAKLSASLLVALALSSAAHAAFIKGVISFSGQANLDNSSLALATKVVSWSGVKAGVPITGDFATYVNDGDSATFTNNWSFNSGAVTPLWTCDGFTFDLTSSTVTSQSSNGLLVNGTGKVSGHGFQSTSGTWDFSTQTGSGTAFRFSASTVAVPDGGTTMALFGLSLLGLYGARQKFGRH